MFRKSGVQQIKTLKEELDKDVIRRVKPVLTLYCTEQAIVLIKGFMSSSNRKGQFAYFASQQWLGCLMARMDVHRDWSALISSRFQASRLFLLLWSASISPAFQLLFLSNANNFFMVTNDLHWLQEKGPMYARSLSLTAASSLLESLTLSTGKIQVSLLSPFFIHIAYAHTCRLRT